MMAVAVQSCPRCNGLLFRDEGDAMCLACGHRYWDGQVRVVAVLAAEPLAGYGCLDCGVELPAYAQRQHMQRCPECQRKAKLARDRQRAVERRAAKKQREVVTA